MWRTSKRWGARALRGSSPAGPATTTLTAADAERLRRAGAGSVAPGVRERRSRRSRGRESPRAGQARDACGSDQPSRRRSPPWTRWSGAPKRPLARSEIPPAAAPARPDSRSVVAARALVPSGSHEVAVANVAMGFGGGPSELGQGGFGGTRKPCACGVHVGAHVDATCVPRAFVHAEARTGRGHVETVTCASGVPRNLRRCAVMEPSGGERTFELFEAIG